MATMTRRSDRLCRGAIVTAALALRAAGLVIGRRNGKSIHYRLASEEARRVMALLHELFCDSGPAQVAQPFEIAAAE